MILNILKVAMRNLIRQFGYTSINILGLAIGLASSILILLYVVNELTYDTFHTKAENIYRVGVQGQMMGNELNQAVTAAPMMEAMLNDYPAVENACRIAEFGGWLVRTGDRKFNETEEDFIFADSSFFEIFDFKLKKGNPETALRSPRTLVMTEKYARKYFGDEDPIGQTLSVEEDTVIYTVTGILENVPVNSHFHFEMVGAMSSVAQSRQTNWLNHNYYTYILLNPETDLSAFEPSMDSMIFKYVGPLIEQFIGVNIEQFTAAGNSFGYFLQPLLDIHLHSDLQVEIEPNGNPAYVYIFSVIAILILIIACINFMNLATARSTTRSREVGIRKVVGSSKSLLITQFLTESVILSIFSLILAVIIVYFVMPFYNNLIRLELSFDIFHNSYTIPLLFLLAILVGLLAGSYPAFILASFKPVSVLKTEMKGGSSKSTLRSLLVIFQFTIAIAILVGTSVVFRQLSFMQKKDLGFEKENVLVIRRSDALEEKIDAFKQDLVQHANIISVANSTHIPSTNYWNNAHWLEGQDKSITLLLMTGYTSYEYADALDLKILEGRYFSRDMPTDSAAIVLNEAAVRVLGLTDPLKTRFMNPGQTPEEDEFMQVIGIVKDFHYESLHEDIHPMALHFMPGNWEGYIIIRLGDGNIPATIDFISQTWDEFGVDYPLDYLWLEDEFNKLFDTDRRTGQILLVFSILSIFISCLGLLGLISYSTTQRNQEIGIRKAMGSSSGLIVLLLTKETVRLMLISALISVPFYFGVKAWLQNFAYHIAFNWIWYIVILIVVAIVVSIIAILTVSIQSYRAAVTNPAESLRQE
ncbi:MAG: ABC transporter permease [Bacteroidales bacterium]|nr:ABC transporter permease [Bacteroidales bacterium]